MKWLLALVLVVPFTLWGIFSLTNHFSYQKNCGGRLKLAADANTVELAKQELRKAVIWLEETGKTEGNSSFIIDVPANDVGFWYKNLKSSLEELEKVTPETSQLERTNLLMKLRETLLDHSGQGGTVVTEPAGITVYPHRWGYLIWAILGVISGIGAVICVIAAVDRH
jgi:hypothetical protein